MTYISTVLIDKVSKGPSESTKEGLRVTRDNVIYLLGSNYEVFLQGSYKNDTAIYDINDIDIVALCVNNIPKNWGNIYHDIVNKISSVPQYQGKVSKGNKCVKLILANKNIDIVPSIRSSDYIKFRNSFNEPIQIFNRANNQIVDNYPKTHYANGTNKNQVTNGNYKKCVRMLKNLINNHNKKDIAPSFYLECLVYSYTEDSLTGDLVGRFYWILNHICYGSDFNYQFTTVAGDKQVLQDTEWSLEKFNSFKLFLQKNINNLSSAINATTQSNADLYFRKFFNL
jgi:hypothetical protein